MDDIERVEQIRILRIRMLSKEVRAVVRFQDQRRTEQKKRNDHQRNKVRDGMITGILRIVVHGASFDISISRKLPILLPSLFRNPSSPTSRGSRGEGARLHRFNPPESQ